MDAIAEQLDARAAALRGYFKENAVLVACLSALAVAAYGFDLFNLRRSVSLAT
jgi:hypothetical protein